MFLAFWLLWLIFNERVTVELMIIGLPVSLMIDLFCRSVLFKPRHKHPHTRLKMLTGGAQYALYMLGEIFKCNIAVLKLILSPDQEPEPQLHYFKTGLRTDPARVTLANSITITPGTITCTMEDDQLCVHALDRTLAEGLTQSESERRLKALEEVYDDAD